MPKAGRSEQQRGRRRKTRQKDDQDGRTNTRKNETCGQTEAADTAVKP